MAKTRKRIWLARYGNQVFCCAGRPNTCNNLRLLKAEESEFHDEAVIEATSRINAILAELKPRAPENHHLALLDTSLGLCLVWAKRIERPDDLSGFVRATSTEREITRALRLVREPETTR